MISYASIDGMENDLSDIAPLLIRSSFVHVWSLFLLYLAPPPDDSDMIRVPEDVTTTQIEMRQAPARLITKVTRPTIQGFEIGTTLYRGGLALYPRLFLVHCSVFQVFPHRLSFSSFLITVFMPFPFVVFKPFITPVVFSLVFLILPYSFLG